MLGIRLLAGLWPGGVHRGVGPVRDRDDGGIGVVVVHRRNPAGRHGQHGRSIIGQIVDTVQRGVDTLLYTDRRIRAEAFDLVPRSGAANAIPGAGTDQLWLTGP